MWTLNNYFDYIIHFEDRKYVMLCRISWCSWSKHSWTLTWTPRGSSWTGSLGISTRCTGLRTRWVAITGTAVLIIQRFSCKNSCQQDVVDWITLVFSSLRAQRSLHLIVLNFHISIIQRKYSDRTKNLFRVFNGYTNFWVHST